MNRKVLHSLDSLEYLAKFPFASLKQLIVRYTTTGMMNEIYTRDFQLEKRKQGDIK